MSSSPDKLDLEPIAQKTNARKENRPMSECILCICVSSKAPVTFQSISPHLLTTSSVCFLLLFFLKFFFKNYQRGEETMC